MNAGEQRTFGVGGTVNVLEYREENVQDDGWEPQSPASEPTASEPGSWDKVEVLAHRVAMGEELWHPEDVVAAAKRSEYDTVFAEIEQ